MKREKLEIAYSVAIIIAIPLLLAANTVYYVTASRAAFNAELRKKADIVNTVVAETVKSNIVSSKIAEVTAALNALEQAQPAITALQVVQQNGTNQVIIAKSNSAAAAMTTSGQIQVKVVYNRKESVSRLINASQGTDQAQAWNVATPIFADDGTVLAVMLSNILTKDAQQTMDTVLVRSFLFMIASMLIIIALLFRHFRLVGYIQLLAKQRELNQTMSDFLSVATHELKAPTTIMKGYIANVLDETSGPISPEVKEQLEVALAQTDRLNGLVQDLLNVSRVEQGRIEYKIEPVDSTAIINVIVSNYIPIANAKNLQLTFDRKTDLPAVKADAGRVQEIFTNLIDNAIKYTPSGSVQISQELLGNMVVTYVKDTGLGVSPENRKRLFQRFYRIRNEHTKDISGTGLGLWIIRQYISAMGGSIELKSQEGAGSEFSVALPINKL